MIHAASRMFEVADTAGQKSFNRTAARIERVVGPIKTTVTLLSDGEQTICLITTHLIAHTRRLYRLIQKLVRRTTGISEENVLVFSSHNHTVPPLTRERSGATYSRGPGIQSDPELTPVGRRWISGLQASLRGLLEELEPVEIAWAVGRQGEISYNRKGRRADGSTYLMREEDRLLERTQLKRSAFGAC